MNLGQFISHRSKCPMCGDNLVTSFYSDKRQSVKLEDNRLVVVFRLDALKKKQMDYKVGYSFGLNDNSWHVEFYNKDDKRFENDSPIFLMKRFKELDKNLSQKPQSGYNFNRRCPRCESYSYTSNHFTLPYNTGQIVDLEIVLEYFGMFQKTNVTDEYKIYKLLNHPQLNKSDLTFGRSGNPQCIRADHGGSLYGSKGQRLPIETISVSLIKFTLKDETMERLDKLLTFS